jgi:hypothetical protein
MQEYNGDDSGFEGEVDEVLEDYSEMAVEAIRDDEFLKDEVFDALESYAEKVDWSKRTGGDIDHIDKAFLLLIKETLRCGAEIVVNQGGYK